MFIDSRLQVMVTSFQDRHTWNTIPGSEYRTIMNNNWIIIGQGSLTGVAATGTKPCWGKNGGDLGPSIPRYSRESKSGYDVRLRPWPRLDGEDDPSLMLRTKMMSATPRAKDSACEDEAKTDDLCQAHGWVRPGTKERCSRSRSLSSEDQNRHTQYWRFLLQRLVIGYDAAIKATPSARWYGSVPSRRAKTMT
jgi:hypothetical protein